MKSTMTKITKLARHQMMFATLDQLVASDSEVRTINTILEKADLAELGFTIKGKTDIGRPSYEEFSLLAIYIYGYLNGIRSSRKLCKACKKDIDLQWLCDGIRPCQKTISEFRRLNAESLPKLFYWFNRYLLGMGFFSSKEYGVDGTLIRGQNSAGNNHSREKIQKALERLDAKSQKYLQDLEASEGEQRDSIQELLDQTQKRQEKYEGLEQQLDEKQNQISMTDPDCRKLTKGIGKGSIIGVNVQAVADVNEKLISAFDVINTGDENALFDMAQLCKEATDHSEIVILADTGYETGKQIKACEDNNITTLVSPKQNNSPKPEGYRKQDFKFNAEDDSYTCPHGHKLTKRGKPKAAKKKGGRATVIQQDYRADVQDCRNCPGRESCVTETMLSKNYGRLIQRRENDQSIEQNRERIEKNPELYSKRKETIEHPFGTIKRSWGYTYTLLKGLKYIKSEFAIIFFCYNLRRLMSMNEITCLVS